MGRCSPGVRPRRPWAPQPFGPSSLFELEPQACPPDSVTPFGPRGSVSSPCCVRRASSRARGSSPLPSLASPLHLFFGVPSSIALYSGSPWGSSLFPSLSLSCAFVLPCPLSLCSPFPFLPPPFPVAWPLRIRALRRLPRSVTRFLSPLSAIPVYLSPSYPGFPQRPSFCPSDILLISPAPYIPVTHLPFPPSSLPLLQGEEFAPHTTVLSLDLH